MAAKRDVLSLINYTRAAAAEFFNDAVMRDGLSEVRLGFRHLAHILGCRRSQINEVGELVGQVLTRKPESGKLERTYPSNQASAGFQVAYLRFKYESLRNHSDRPQPRLPELRPFRDWKLCAPQSEPMPAVCVQVHLHGNAGLLQCCATCQPKRAPPALFIGQYKPDHLTHPTDYKGRSNMPLRKTAS